MSFDYDADTRQRYKSDQVAKAYHHTFTQSGPAGWRFRFIAQRERAAVQQLLGKVPHKSVIDVPTGTGKMAPIFAAMGCRVTACDVSPNMLEIAKASFEEAGCEVESFRVVDLEKATEVLTERVDVLVCIRLMHRVPDDVKRRMLQQISLIAPSAIVSFAISNPWQRFRLFLSRTFLGALGEGRHTHKGMSSSISLIEEFFDIRSRAPVSRLLSSEWVFLLSSRHASDA